MNIDRPTLSRAFSQSFRSLAGKLPILAFAAFACYGLFYLDRAKNDFKESQSPRPVFIDEWFLEALDQEVKPTVERDWAEIKKFISIPQYSTKPDFINKLGVQISKSMESEVFVADEGLKVCISNVLEDKPNEANTADNQLNKSKLANHVKGSSPEPNNSESIKIGPTQRCANDYNSAYLSSSFTTQKRIALVYHLLKPLEFDQIKQKAVALESAAKSLTPPTVSADTAFLKNSISPILDEQSGLYVIFQVLRISCVVVIIFSFILFITFLLKALFLSDGVSTFTGTVTKLIDVAPSGAMPSAARSAALSLSLLGVGGAVAAGVAIGDKANGLTSPRSSERYFSSKVPQSGNSASEVSLPPELVTDNSNTVYDYSARGNFLDYSQHDSQGLNPIVRLYPIINTPPSTLQFSEELEKELKEFLAKRETGDSGLTRDQVTLLTSSLKSLEDVNKQVLTDLKNLKTPSPTDQIKVTNPMDPNGDKPLKVELADKGQLSTTIEDLRKSISSTQSTIELLQTIDDAPAKPNNSSSIWGRIFRSDKYFVSKRSAEQIKRIIQSSKKETATTSHASSTPAEGADDVIGKVLDYLYLEGGKPLDEKDFIAKLKGTLSKQVTLVEKTALEARFNHWRATILTYTRVS